MQSTNKIKNHLLNKWQHLKTKQLFVACSGGVDSISILSYLSQLEFKVTALHVNYKLRGKDSDEDESFVKAFCEKQNIPFHCLKVDLKTQLEQGGNLQEVCKYGLSKNVGLLINSSRGIIYASKDENYAKKAAKKAEELQKQMEEILNSNFSV